MACGIIDTQVRYDWIRRVLFYQGNNFILMMEKNGNKTYKYRQLFTETYLSSMSNNDQAELLDKNVYKAIKENNVEYLVDKDHQVAVEPATLYDEEKELGAVIVDIRKRYDQTKIETTRLEKAIANLEEEKVYLNTQFDMIQKETNATKANHSQLEKKHVDFEDSLEYIEYLRDVRYNMEQRLKSDILHFKKQCFDSNVTLIRLKTCIREQNQKSNMKKHLQTRSKLVLNTLQETVKMRETERDNHLKQVHTLLMRKQQNTQIKVSREKEIEQSMYKALTERLPQENFLLKKLYCELFLRKMLRTKMNSLIQQYKQVQYAFNTIKKETKVANVSQFIEDYLRKDQRYGNLLSSIQKNDKKIAEQKKQSELLMSKKAKLELQSAEIDEAYSKINHKQREDNQLYKKLVFYNEEVIKMEELKIMLMRWATKSNASLATLSKNTNNHQSLQLNQVPHDIPMLKKTIQQALKAISKAMTENEEQMATPEKKSQLKTQMSEERFNLRTLTSESVLSKQYSRKNFRVRTMTGHQEAPPEHDNEYDDLSEYDFLKYNRRMVKKNNIKSQRPRIKTKLF